jgi:acyl dehydratase
MNKNYADPTLYVVKGPIEEGMEWVGREMVIEAPFAVNEAQIAYFAAMLEDPNENYWDADAAGKRYGSIISPGGMFQTWIFPTPWRPNGQPEHGPVYALEVPLPGETLINVTTDTTFHAPMRVGDRLSYTDRIESISPLKRTAVGEGYFVTTRTICRNQDGDDLATNVNVVYRYDTVAQTPDTSTPSPARPAADPGVERLPEIILPITLSKLVMNAAATRDYFPGHHDRDYAQGQGVRDAYHNTMYLQGFVDRAGYEWAGPDAWLIRRQLRMVVPACNGDTMRTDGRVVERREENGRRIVDVDIDVLTEHGLAVTTRLTFDLDGWDDEQKES